RRPCLERSDRRRGVRAEAEAFPHRRALDLIALDQREDQVGAWAGRVDEALGRLGAQLMLEMGRRVLQVRNDLTEAPARLAPPDVPRFQHDRTGAALGEMDGRGQTRVAAAD